MRTKSANLFKIGNGSIIAQAHGESGINLLVSEDRLRDVISDLELKIEILEYRLDTGCTDEEARVAIETKHKLKE